jgi:CHAD domain-containing protein
LPYRLRAGESVRRGINRIAVEEIHCAIRRLTHGKDRDEAVHDARKSVKKIRGAIRLVRFDFGDQFAAEIAFFRDIGRKLSELRDTQAMLEIFDGLIEKYSAELGSKTLDSVRVALVARKERFELSQNAGAVIEDVLKDLRRARHRVDRWPLSSNGFAAVAPGLVTTFKQGRRAFAAAYEKPLPENFHEFRKRAKDHWYHIRLFQNLWTPALAAYESSLKSLEQALGDDHNLVVLRETIATNPASFTDSHDLQAAFSLMDKYQQELRIAARGIGERIYGQRPRDFGAQMQRSWEGWKHEAERSWARRTLPVRRTVPVKKTEALASASAVAPLRLRPASAQSLPRRAAPTSGPPPAPRRSK